MILIKKVISLTIYIHSILGTIAAQDLLDYVNSLKYAEYLYQTHQYNLAAGEFERVVFLEPEDTLSKLKLIRSYRFLNDYTTAIEKIEYLFPYSLNNYPAEISNEYVINLLYKNQFEKADAFLQNNITLNRICKAEYQLGIFIMQNHWPEARFFANDNIAYLKDSDKYGTMNNIIENGLSTHYKKPLLAASLSAILPGSGKFYTGHWKDAIFSMLIVTTTSWLTYKSFKNNGLSPNSILIGTLAVGFYSANIYGSAKSANRYNQRINQSFQKEVKEVLLND
jgi:tetratricopeptide (TPR) repeat protein